MGRTYRDAARIARRELARVVPLDLDTAAISAYTGRRSRHADRRVARLQRLYPTVAAVFPTPALQAIARGLQGERAWRYLAALAAFRGQAPPSPRDRRLRALLGAPGGAWYVAMAQRAAATEPDYVRGARPKRDHPRATGDAEPPAGRWDGNAAMAGCSSAENPAACYRAICAGRRAGDPNLRQTWALPHHRTADSPADPAGVAAALRRLPLTKGLQDPEAARRHLEGHQQETAATVAAILASAGPARGPSVPRTPENVDTARRLDIPAHVLGWGPR